MSVPLSGKGDRLFRHRELVDVDMTHPEAVGAPGQIVHVARDGEAGRAEHGPVQAEKFDFSSPTISSQSGSGSSWPIPSNSTSRAPGMARAIERPPDGRINLSALPWMTTVGALV